MKKLLLIVLICTFAVSVFAKKEKEKEETTEEESLYRPIDTSQFATARLAIKDLDMLIRIDPTISTAYIRRALIHRHMTSYTKSNVDFYKAISLESDSAMIAVLYYWIGGAYDRLGEFEKSLDAFNKSIDIGSRHSEIVTEVGVPELDAGYQLYAVIYDKGIILNRLERYDEAQKSFETVLKIHPDMGPAYFGIGLCYENRKEYAEAISNYKKSIELQPNFHPPYNNIAYIYSKQKNYKLAQKYTKMAIETNPNYMLGWLNYARFSKKNKDDKNACIAIEKFIELNGGYIDEKSKNKLLKKYCN